MSKKRELCPAPNYGEIVNSRMSIFVDGRKRPWHAKCAKKVLSEHFRTPIDYETIAGEKIEITVPEGQMIDMTELNCLHKSFAWTPEYDMFVHHIEFPAGLDVTLTGLFNGANNILCTNHMGHRGFVPGDFPNPIFPVGARLHMGIPLTFQFSPYFKKPVCFQVKVVGERIDPKAPNKKTEKGAFAVGGFDAVTPDAEGKAEVWVSMPAEFMGADLALDDFEGVEIERVKVGGGPGRAADEEKEVPVGEVVKGRLTPLPMFVARACEQIRIEFRSKTGRPISGRLYGQVKW